MQNLVSLLMVLLFVVAMVVKVVFDEDGLQADANDLKDNTQEIIGDANSVMESFGSSTKTP